MFLFSSTNNVLKYDKICRVIAHPHLLMWVTNDQFYYHKLHTVILIDQIGTKNGSCW